LSLPGQYRSPHACGPVAGHSVRSLAGASNPVSSGIPSDNAASIVNSLNVDPVG
jgi:hypothetical protein